MKSYWNYVIVFFFGTEKGMNENVILNVNPRDVSKISCKSIY